MALQRLNQADIKMVKLQTAFTAVNSQLLSTELSIFVVIILLHSCLIVVYLTDKYTFLGNKAKVSDCVPPDSDKKLPFFSRDRLFLAYDTHLSF